MFSFIFGQLCDKKKKKNLCIRRDGNWKKGCVGCRWDGQKSLGRQFLFCLYVCVCGMEGGRLSEKIRHQMLLYKQNIRKPHLSRLFALFNED